MSSAVNSVPQKRALEAVQPNGAGGGSGPSVECGSTRGDLAPRSPDLGPGDGGGPALDKNAKSTANSQAEKLAAVAAGRVERFAMQAGARHLLPSERVGNCLRARIFGKEAVELWHIPETASARFGGLQTCGSVWMCPVCAAKISERRKGELETAIKAAHALGWAVAMVTLTIPHGRQDDPRELVKRMMTARGKATGHGSMRKASALACVEGTARALEHTWGPVSGHHPHIHELIFASSFAHLGKLRAEIRKQWFAAVEKAGLGKCSRKGFNWTMADTDIAGYVAKFGRDRAWNVEHELTKQVTKRGRGGDAANRYTPMELLHNFTFNGDYEAGQKFREYAGAMKGRAQLYIAPKLRAKLITVLEPAEAVKLVEKDDGELAEEREHKGLLLSLIPFSVWQRVLHTNSRAELLNLAAKGDETAVASFLAGLGNFNGSGRVVETPRPKLIQRGVDERDCLFPVPDPFESDPLVVLIKKGAYGRCDNIKEAVGMAKTLYALRGDGVPVPYFENRIKEREKMLADLAESPPEIVEKDANKCLLL